MALEPVVRRAVSSDLDPIVEIDGVSRLALIDQRGGHAWLAEHPALANLVAVDVIEHCVVGLIDDVVVGLALWEIVDDSERGAILRIDRVHVVSQARELGFGDALLAMMVDIGRTRGCRYVEAQALPGDRETKNLYERAGITARLITVSRRLEG
ncbi:MAG: GNAT family N-acetyltransferase [Actinobacteria bacterium]|nr:GNAT family N-acetyltransferase [Actinomycetota bacterium]